MIAHQQSKSKMNWCTEFVEKTMKVGDWRLCEWWRCWWWCLCCCCCCCFTATNAQRTTFKFTKCAENWIAKMIKTNTHTENKPYQNTPPHFTWLKHILAVRIITLPIQIQYLARIPIIDGWFVYSIGCCCCCCCYSLFLSILLVVSVRE